MLHVGLGMIVHEKDANVGRTDSRAMSEVATVDFVFECAGNVEKENAEELVAHGWP